THSVVYQGGVCQLPATAASVGRQPLPFSLYDLPHFSGTARCCTAPGHCLATNTLAATHGSSTMTNPSGARHTRTIARCGQGPSARTNGGMTMPAGGLPTKP